MANMQEVQRNWTEITAQLHSDPERYLEFLRFSASLYGLTFSNAALVFRENPSLTRVATAAGWNSIGLSVRAGEHGITVFDETESQNALLFLFDESQVIDRRNPTEPPKMPQSVSFSAYERQLCDAVGVQEQQAFADFAQLSAGVADHFIRQETVQRRIDSHCKAANWDTVQKQQYTRMLADTVRYVVQLHCVQDVPNAQVQAPDLSSFSLFGHDTANLIRFGTLAQRIYTKGIRALRDFTNTIHSEEIENDQSRTNENERIDSRNRTGRELRDNPQRRTGTAAESGENVSGQVGQAVGTVDEPKSSGNEAPDHSFQAVRSGSHHERSGHHSAGTVRGTGQAVPAAESTAGQGNRPERLSDMGHETAAKHRTTGSGRSGLSDSGSVPKIEGNQAEAESSVSAFFAEESPIHFGLFGNGITAYDVSRTDPETNDYPTVAHISEEGAVKIYDDSLSAEDIERINEQAQPAREKFMSDWNKLSVTVQYQRLLDNADITTSVNVMNDKISTEEKIAKYMPFVFFKEGERPEPQTEEQQFQRLLDREDASRVPTEEEVLFQKADLAMFLAERTLSSDEWEDMAYPLFENGYLDTHKPNDKGAFGYHLSEPAFYDLAQRYHDGEDIRHELAISLMEHTASENIEFVFEDGKISGRTFYYAENLRHTFHAEFGEDSVKCSFNDMEREVTYEQIGQAFLDRTHEEFNDLMYWRVLDYIKDDIPDISDETVQQLITAFDSAARPDWESNLQKRRQIKRALYDVLGNDDQTEKAFACIAKEKYNVSFDTEQKESSIHFGLFGNGVTAYDVSRTDPETHDYGFQHRFL